MRYLSQRLLQIVFGLPLYLTLAVLGLGAPGNRPRPTDPQPPPATNLSLRLSSLQGISSAMGDAGKIGAAYPLMTKLLGLPSRGAALIAFEENRNFVFAAGKFPGGPAGTQWIRRVIFLRPSVFIVDDEMDSPDAYGARFYFGPAKPQIHGARARIRADEQTIILRTLIPAGASIGTSPAAPPDEPFLEVTAKAARRFLHVISLDAKGPGEDIPLSLAEDKLELTLPEKGTRFELTFPSEGTGAWTLAATSSQGKALLAKRPLPSGVMPHDAEGILLLDVWDGDYRGGRHPKWDTGQPSADLKKAIDAGVLKPGRTVEFGCGTGTDAIYMASRGFDVTAIDISPSAIAQAVEKARKAGVRVHFMLADALNPPDIGKFDLIYDRACYHEVRGQNLNAYLETLRKASRAGTQMLLLAGNANGPDLGFGPPTVTEEELRFDFMPLFDVEWLRESRFEVNPPAAGFPLAWSVLMRRKAD